MNKRLMFATLAAFTLAGSSAYAGTKYDQTLAVNLSGYNASGAVGSVRQGGSSNDVLGCLVLSGQPAPAELQVECHATSATGSLICASTDEALIEVAQSMQADSYITFSGQSCGPGCCTLTALSVFNGSPFAPVQP